VAGGCRRLHNEELHNICASWNIVTVFKKRRPHGRHRLRWKDIRTDLREIRREGVNWIHLAQDKDQWRTLVNTVMNLRVP
jgi:hypothetical protein